MLKPVSHVPMRPDPDGWRRTFVEESARQDPKPAAVTLIGHFIFGFVVGFIPLAILADVVIR